MRLRNVSICPVCGRVPTAKTTLLGEVVIQCKPSFGKVHLRAKSSFWDIFGKRTKAVKAWNNAAASMAKITFDERCVDNARRVQTEMSLL